MSYIAYGLAKLCMQDTEQPDSNQWGTVVHAKASKNILYGILVGVSAKMKNVHPMHLIVHKHAKSHLCIVTTYIIV